MPQPHAALLGAVHPDDRERMARAWMEALRGRAPYDLDHSIVVDGAVRWMHACASFEFAADGLLRGGFGTTQDITDRMEAELRLRAARVEAERADNAKSRFLAAASHDLRQPLAALALYVDLLARRATPIDGVPVQSMKDCVSSLSELLADLLDLSKLEAGVVAPEPRDFLVDSVLSRVISAQAPAARAKGLDLRYAARDVTARTDPVLLGRIVARPALLGLEVRVRSRVCKGSMFAVEVPPGRNVVALTEPAPAPWTLRIALVDDNPAVLTALAWSLRAVGHEVVEARAGGALLAALAGQAPDLLISDYRLAGGDTGLDVVHAVRAACDAHLPAIVVTGDTDPGLMRGIDDPRIAVHHKPVELDALQRSIAALFGHA